MRLGAIVLARLDSRRLPGKALRQVAGRPLVQYAFDACAATRGVDEVVLATSDRPEDDPLADYAERQSIACFRGSIDDVAARFLGAMQRFDFQGAVRFSGDSPLHRPDLLAEAVGVFRSGNWDLVTNVPGRTFPYGISVEVVGRSIMEKACATMTRDDEREHVTKFFYDHPSFARSYFMASSIDEMSGIQLAVDDASDLARTEWILGRLEVPLRHAPLTKIVQLAKAYVPDRS